MYFELFGKEEGKTLLLIPGLGVSYQLFNPLVDLLDKEYRIVVVQVDGFVLGHHTQFTSIDDQAAQVIAYIKQHFNGEIDCTYGLSLGGKILSRVLQRNEITISHAILDAAPLLPLPRWLEGMLRHYQSWNVWSCYHWTAFWKWLFHSHYFDTLLDECRKVFPFGGRRSVLDGYKSIYTNRLNSISGPDIHFWYGTKESFVAKPQARHLLSLCSDVHIEVFPKMNHGQLLIDHPEEVATRIRHLTIV